MSPNQFKYGFLTFINLVATNIFTVSATVMFTQANWNLFLMSSILTTIAAVVLMMSLQRLNKANQNLIK